MTNKNKKIKLVLDGKIREIDCNQSVYTPTTTVLNYLRSLPNHKGVKEGCAEGDCGACSVVVASNFNGKLRYEAYDSCLLFLPMLHGKQLITVEEIGNSDNMHPVQQAMVTTDGSQCGYCTPGFISSLFALYKSGKRNSKTEIEDALTGNLCRCTGYRPIIDAAVQSCTEPKADKFTESESEIIELLNKINASNETLEIKTEKQHYFHPVTLQSALELKAKYPDALLINGATDVGLMVTKQNKLLPLIIDLSGVAELKSINENDNNWIYGAGLSLEDVKNNCNDKLPALYDMLAVFGSRQIRSLATFGGNIANASPIGDTPPVLMSYEASVVLNSINGERTLKLTDFVTGYRTTAIAKNEIITQIIIPKEQSDIVVKSYKISKRKDLDISTVSAGFNLKLENDKVQQLSLYYGGMAAMTKRAKKAENFLIGKVWERNNIETAMQLIEQEFEPISDARATKEGRAVMAKNLLLKFWSETKVN